MRFATINFYVGNTRPVKDVDLIGRLGLDVAGLQEAWRHDGLIDTRLKGYEVLNARRSDSKAAEEVSVLVSKKVNLLGWSGRKVSSVSPSEETKIFKERWITIVRFMKDGKKYVLINYHGNAVVQSKKTGKLLKNERTREWVAAAREIDKTIKAYQSDGYVVLVTGDWNYRKFGGIKGFVLDYWSPQRIFKRNKMSWYERGLDYIAWSGTEKRKGKVRVIPTAVTGSDHPWIVVDLL